MKFSDLYESVMNEGKEDAPNYRKAGQADGVVEPACTACKFNNKGECAKYDFMFDKGYTCDEFEHKDDYSE
jgi:hypothetical protein